MEDYVNPHIQEWQQYTQQMVEAMNSGDVERVEQLKALADEAYNQYKTEADKMYSCNGFSSCNEAIQDSLPRLVKENTKAVREIMQTIMEDNNLKAQLSFYNSINKCSSDDTISYINEAIQLVSPNIDLKTIKESNNKLIKLVRKYGILPESKFSDEKTRMFESCDYLMSHKKKITNLNEYTKSLNTLNEYVKQHKNNVNETKFNADAVMRDFDNKYYGLLNNEERNLFSEIVSEKTSKARKEQIFNEMKSECLKGVECLIRENKNEQEDLDLTHINENIKTKTFNEGTFIEDCAKFMSLREVLLEK